MQKQISVLFIGESWFIDITETKGFDKFTVSRYEEGTKWIKQALTGDHFLFTHLPCHRIEYEFPQTVEDLLAYDVIMISDVGANTFLLPTDTFFHGRISANKLEMIKEFVYEGGGLGMIGGYMTFQGINAKGHYKGSPIEDILPVNMLDGDDRVEVPQSFSMNILQPKHKIFLGLDDGIPNLLGYNKLIKKEKAELIAEYNDDPIISAWQYGKGFTLAYASDCAPHWAPLEFCNWVGYSTFWQNIVRYLAQGKTKLIENS